MFLCPLLVCVAWGCFFIPTVEVKHLPEMAWLTDSKQSLGWIGGAHWGGSHGRAPPPPRGALSSHQEVGGMGPPESGQWPEVRLKQPAQPWSTSQDVQEAGSVAGPSMDGALGQAGRAQHGF